MAYILKHPTWFSERPRCKTNNFGIIPSSKFLYKENEIEAYKNSSSLMSQALMIVSNQVTEKSASLICKKNSDSSYTNGKRIVIGMNPIKQHDDLFDGMDIEIGLACHESCHCAYTDFNDYSMMKCNYPIAHWLHNLYEDECIEEMLGKRYPQWMHFLDAIISHYFTSKKFISETKKLYDTDDNIGIAQFMILFMVRKSEFSNRFPSEWMDQFGPMLDEIYEKVIVNLEKAKDNCQYTPTSLTSKSALDTIEIIKKYVTLDDLVSKLKKPSLGMIGNSSSEGNPNQDKNCGENGLFSPNTRKDRKKSSDAIDNRYENAKKEANKEESSKDGQSSPVNKAEFNTASKEIGAAKPTQSDIAKYNRAASQVREEISIAKRIIIPNDKKIELEDDKFHRNGQLINSHLVQAIQGVNCVYQRKVQKVKDSTNPKYAFVIAIDESGSMGYGTTLCPSIIASYLSIIFYEAMKDFPGIDIFIYGHGDNVVKYVSPKDKNPGRLACRQVQLSQNEAISYDTILRDVRLQTNKQIFFLNITDSMYLEDDKKIISVIDKWKLENVLFGLLSIKTEIQHSQYSYVVKLNEYLYGDRYIEVNETENGMKEALKKFATIIRKNYDKFKR